MPSITWFILGTGSAVSVVFVCASLWLRWRGREVPELAVSLFQLFGLMVGAGILMNASFEQVRQLMG